MESNKRKKRQRRDDESDDEMMEDDNIIIDEAMQGMAKKDLDTSGDVDMNNEGIIYTDFVFSGLKDNYFHNVKTLIRPLFEFDNVNLSGLADLILSLKEDVGSAIKTEDEEETNNPNVDIFGVFSLVPLTFYANGSGKDSDVVSKQILACLQSKVNTYATSSQDKITAANILNKSRVGLLISERVINLPQDAIPIVFNFLIKEIGECKEDDSYDNKFELDNLVIISKFVKRLAVDQGKRVKKAKSDFSNDGGEEILQYKFETEHFMKKALVNITYKIPYDQMNLDYLENKNEPQYYSILFIKFSDFYDVVNALNK